MQIFSHRMVKVLTGVSRFFAGGLSSSSMGRALVCHMADGVMWYFMTGCIWLYVKSLPYFNNIDRIITKFFNQIINTQPDLSSPKLLPLFTK